MPLATPRVALHQTKPPGVGVFPGAGAILAPGPRLVSLIILASLATTAAVLTPTGGLTSAPRTPPATPAPAQPSRVLPAAGPQASTPPTRKVSSQASRIPVPLTPSTGNQVARPRASLPSVSPPSPTTQSPADAASQQGSPSQQFVRSFSAPSVSRRLTPKPSSSSQRPSLPAALVPDNPHVPIKTNQEVDQWERLQDQFINDVQNKYPSDQAERERWLAAQQYNDNLFRARFGTYAFVVQSIESTRLRNSGRSP